MFFSKKSDDISKEDAIKIAKYVCKNEDWHWLEPVSVLNGFRKWTVITNHECIGLNARIVINKKSGEVISKSFIKR